MLKGKTVIVTGANGALGSAVASTAKAHGAEVIAVDLAFSGDDPSAKRITVDLTNAAEVANAFEDIDRIDALFNIAGGFDMGPAVHETSAELWDRMFAINATTARNACAAAVPKMLSAGVGRIVNVGANSAREGQGNMGAYCVAKSAVMRMTESLSKEVRQQGINVNAVLPSIIDTPTNRRDMPDADFSKWVTPAALGEVICFLGSDGAAAVHGALIPVVGLS